MTSEKVYRRRSSGAETVLFVDDVVDVCALAEDDGVCDMCGST